MPPHKRLKIPVYLFFSFLGLLALGWIWGAATNWSEIAARPARLAYLICDVLIVIPAGVIAGRGLLRRRSWAPIMFAFALGALAFDLTHGVFYMRWDNFLGIPWVASLAVLILFAAFVVYTMRLVQHAGQPDLVRSHV